MTRDRVSGVTLIVGALGMLVTMALHPAPHSLQAMVRQADLAVGTHSLALATIPVSFVGFLGLYHRLRADAAFAPAAIVTHAFGATAVMCAAVVSGLVAPAYAIHFSGDPNTQQTLLAVLSYNGQLNKSFAMVFMFATPVAILCWSTAILTTRALPRWIGWGGYVVGIAALVGVFAGALNTSVGGFGLFILLTSTWIIVVGVRLYRSPVPEVSAIQNASPSG